MEVAKDIVSAYRNVCSELEGLEAYEKLTRSTLEQAHRVVFKGKKPSSGSMCYVPLNVALMDYNEAVDDYNETVHQLEKYKATKEQLESIISKYSDVEQLILLLHVEQGMSLREVAEKSHYSYKYIRKMSSIIKNKSKIKECV